MITLFDNPFSPFARKVRMVLLHKGLAFESIDGLAHKQRERLLSINPRGEVPAIVDNAFCVIGSADIVAYLEDRYPEPPVMPRDPQARADARAWQRLADTTCDAILHDISIWTWPMLNRQDAPPAGLIEAGHADIAKILAKMETSLAGREFLCGEFSIADLALFTHVSGLKFLGVEFGRESHPCVFSWFTRLRTLPPIQKDLENLKAFLTQDFGKSVPTKDESQKSKRHPYEERKIVWRGDRLEWLFLKGYQDWWLEELKAGRVSIPVAI